MGETRKTRKFDGKIYKRYMSFENEFEAIRIKKKLKKRGFLARVVPVKKDGKITKYRIYRKRK